MQVTESTHLQAARSSRTKPHASPETCIYCGSEQLSPWVVNVEDRFSYVPGQWSFKVCNHCGSGNISPRPEADELAGFYPDVYTPSPDQRPKGLLAKAQSFCEFQVFYRLAYASQIRTVSRIAGLTRQHHAKLLDVGCGHGVRLQAFRGIGCEVEGADIDAGAVAYVRDKLGVPAVHCNLDALANHFAGESFDIVTAFYLLEHLVDVRSSLVAIHRLLRPGGWFFGAVPLIDSTQAKLLNRRWLSVTEAPRHISLPSRRALMSLMQGVGFDAKSLATHADSSLICSAVAALSLLPQTSTTHMATQGNVTRILARFLAGGLAMVMLPWALADKYLFDTPSLAIVCGQKPL